VINSSPEARKRWKKAGVVLLTVFLLIAPFGTLIMAVYGARRVYADRRRRRPAPAEAYTWLALRSIARTHTVGELSRSARSADLSIAGS